MDPISIIVVDDHKIIRDGIRSMLIGNRSINITGEASQGYELFELLKSNVPHVILLDIVLPKMSGIEIAKVVSRDHPEIRILILTANTDEHTLLSSMKAGATGFLPKDTSREELIEAIQTVRHGNHYFGRNISGILHKTLLENLEHRKGSSEEKELTDREKEIIRLFAEGYTYKQIAEQLNISARTVEAHKNNILHKLGLRNTIDLVKYAIKNRIIEI